MKCKEAQLLIAGLSGDAIPDDLAEHLGGCSACAELLSADIRLRSALRTPTATPSFEFDMIREAATRPGQTQVIGLELLRRPKPIMRYTVTALAASLAVAALMAIPGRVQAAQPLATFTKMKQAVNSQVSKASQTNVIVGLQSSISKGKSWAVIDGQLIEITSTFEFQVPAGTHEVTVYETTDDSGNTNPVIMLNTEQAPGPRSVAIVNGKAVSLSEIQKMMKSAHASFGMSVDLNASHYRQIAFGSDEHTLILTPRSGAAERTMVTLDANSDLPKAVVLEKQVNGKWVDIKKSNVTLG
jgi:hypothetical protein